MFQSSKSTRSSTHSEHLYEAPSLLTLPPELRIRIYEFVFSDALIRTLHASTRPTHLVGRGQRVPVDLNVFRPRTAILAVCHTTRSEALPVYAGKLVVRTSYSCLHDLYNAKMPPFLRSNVHALIVSPVCGGCDRAMHLPAQYLAQDTPETVFPNLKRIVLETQYAKDYFALEGSGFADGRCKCVVVKSRRTSGAEPVQCAKGLLLDERKCVTHCGLDPLRVDHWPSRDLRRMWTTDPHTAVEVVLERELYAAASGGVDSGARSHGAAVCYRLRTSWDYDTMQKLGQWVFCGNTGRSQTSCDCGAGGAVGWNCATGRLEDTKQIDWEAGYQGTSKEREKWMRRTNKDETGDETTARENTMDSTAYFFRIR